jgi:hypothetical protein
MGTTIPGISTRRTEFKYQPDSPGCLSCCGRRWSRDRAHIPALTHASAQVSHSRDIRIAAALPFKPVLRVRPAANILGFEGAPKLLSDFPESDIVTLPTRR